MELLQDIKRKREKQRKRQPIKRGVFNQISGLVKWYGLEGCFLEALDEVEQYSSRQRIELPRVRMKSSIERPLFSLVTEEEYSLTMSIISKVDNSYLEFAQSPGEILLCRHLYRLNPSLSPEKLRRYHFETLLLHERSKTTNKESNGYLTEKIEAGLQTGPAPNGMPEPGTK